MQQTLTGRKKQLYPKKRASIACEVCRSRKMRCDGDTPQCGFCKSVGAECTYVAATPNKNEEIGSVSTQARLAALEENVAKIDQIVSVLSAQAQFQPDSLRQFAASIEVSHPGLCANFGHSGILRHMTASLDYDVVGYLTDLEATEAPASAMSLPTDPLNLLDVRHLTAFFDKVHIWYPILDKDLLESEYTSASDGALTPSCRNSLYLMVSAIGALALDLESGRIHSFCDQAVHAQRMLYTVISDHGLQAIQCLLLHALYQLLCFRPLQAYEHVIAAAYKVHNIHRRHQLQTLVDSELFKRAFYAIYIMERELLVQLNLACSGLSELEEHVPLPSGTLKDGYQEGATFAFFLAEISIQKVMEQSDRNFSATTSQNHGEIQFPTLVAKELEYQILGWRNHLPAALAFPDVGFCRSDLSLYLKLQFFAHNVGIFWLALYKAIMTDEMSAELTFAGQKCILSYCSFIDTASDFFSKPVTLPHIAMTLTSIFTISLSMVFVRNAEKITSGIEHLDNAFRTAVKILSRCSTLYPAVGDWAEVLQNRLNLGS